MNFEYLYVETILYKSNESIIQLLSNLDKLFLKITIIDEQMISISSSQLQKFKEIGASKIVFVVASSHYDVPPKNFSPIKEWTGSIIQEDSNYLYKNYNFINSKPTETFRQHLIDGRINIMMSTTSWHLNDKLRLWNSEIYIDLMVTPQGIGGHRLLLFFNGTLQLHNTVLCPIQNSQYIELIGNKVYLKPPAIYE